MIRFEGEIPNKINFFIALIGIDRFLNVETCEPAMENPLTCDIVA
jgi:hypothetical protein